MRVAVACALTMMLAAVPAGFQGPGGGAPAPPPPPADLSAFAPRSAVAALDAVSPALRRAGGDGPGRVHGPFWRNAGNAGFDRRSTGSRAASRRRVLARATGPADGPSLWVEQYGKAQGWDYTVGTLALAADDARARARCCCRASGSAWRSASTRSRRRPAAWWRR